MKPWNDASPFLADFGEPVLAGGLSFKAIVDFPASYLDTGDGSSRIVSGETLMRYPTGAASLRRGDKVVIRGKTYILREHPVRTGDGVFSEVLLGEVTA